MSLATRLMIPLFLALLAYLLVILPEQYFYVGFETTPRPQGTADATPIPDRSKDGIYRETVKFDSNGTSCEGWLYIPDKDKSLKNPNGFPAIVMGHGIGSTKDMGLYRFAQKFASNGIVVLLIDYRHYGNSNGKPRHLLSPSNHVNDFHNGVKYLRNLNKFIKIDSNRIGLWGTSYAGGHVVTAASQDSSLKCIVSQMPFLGPLPSESKLDELKKRGYTNVLFGMWGAISDTIRSRLNFYFKNIFNFQPLYGRMYGHKGDKDMSLNTWENFDSSEKKWLSKHPKVRPNDWRNAFLLRSMFEMSSYRPLLSTPNIDESVPVLYIKAIGDKLCPTNRIDLANEWTKNSEIYGYEVSHFGMYNGKPFDDVSDRQLQFLKKHFASS